MSFQAGIFIYLEKPYAVNPLSTSHKMVKHELFECVRPLVGLALKELREYSVNQVTV